jgi:phage terminase Nu1 subunit (DNA packaging protein)
MREVIEGWKGIAEFFGRGPRTVQVWEREAGLPVHRLQKRVSAYRDELEEWRRQHTDDSQPAASQTAAPEIPRKTVASEPERGRLLWGWISSLRQGLWRQASRP